MFQRVLAACAVALLLVSVPSALTAQEKEARAAEQTSVFGWLGEVWSDVAAWLASDGRPSAPPASSAETSGDAGCMINPDGCSQGG